MLNTNIIVLKTPADALVNCSPPVGQLMLLLKCFVAFYVDVDCVVKCKRAIIRAADRPWSEDVLSSLQCRHSKYSKLVLIPCNASSPFVLIILVEPPAFTYYIFKDRQEGSQMYAIFNSFALGLFILCLGKPI